MPKEISYTKKKGKYVINKDSTYLSLTPEQVVELYQLLEEIIMEITE